MSDKPFHFQKIDDPIGLAEQIADERKAEEQADEERRFLACVFDPDEPIEEPAPIISMKTPNGDFTPVVTRGNISAIVGQPKCRKSFFVCLLSAMVLNESKVSKVLVFDTEQAKSHIKRCYFRIVRLLEDSSHHNEIIKYLRTRELDSNTRKKYLEMAIDKYAPDVVFIDGIADLVNNPNDEAETKEIVQAIMSLSTKHNCAICSVLHLNPVSKYDPKPRGHLGSELLRKCESVIELKRNGDITQVKPYQDTCTRDRPFAQCAFRIDDHGLPRWCVIVPKPPKENELPSLMKDVFWGKQTMTYTELWKAIVSKTRKSERTSKGNISTALKDGIIGKTAIGEPDKGLYFLIKGNEPQQASLDLTSDSEDEYTEDYDEPPYHWDN